MLLSRLALDLRLPLREMLDLHLEALADSIEHDLFGRDLALGDLDLVDVLEVLEVADVQPRHQRDGDARLARASGPARSVDVHLGRFRRRDDEGGPIFEVADVLFRLF